MRHIQITITKGHSMSKKNEEYQEDQLFQYWETIAQSSKLHSQILANTCNFGVFKGDRREIEKHSRRRSNEKYLT